jgi:predicted DNA-binding transcriptional regulator AlpA
MRSDTNVEGVDNDLAKLVRMVVAETRESVVETLRSNPIIATEWLSLQSAAQYLGYSEQQMSEFVRTKRAPKSVLFSRNARRMKRSDCDAWAAAGGPSQFPAVQS